MQFFRNIVTNEDVITDFINLLLLKRSNRPAPNQFVSQMPHHSIRFLDKRQRALLSTLSGTSITCVRMRTTEVIVANNLRQRKSLEGRCRRTPPRVSSREQSGRILVCCSGEFRFVSAFHISITVAVVVCKQISPSATEIIHGDRSLLLKGKNGRVISRNDVEKFERFEQLRCCHVQQRRNTVFS